MLRRFRERMEFTRRLGFRLGMLLSVAILPIGLISLIQTFSLSREASRASELALIGRTTAAAAGERALLQTALGTADAIGPAVLDTNLAGNIHNCMDMLESFVERSSLFIFAGFTDLTGLSTCNSTGQIADMSLSMSYQLFLEEPGTHIFATPKGFMSGQPAVVILQPVYKGSNLYGFISVSIAHDLLQSTHVSSFPLKGTKLVTFSGKGELLSFYSDDQENQVEFLPVDIELADLAGIPETTFYASTASGQERVFSVVPIVPGLAYAMGSFAPGDSGVGGFKFANVTAVLFTLSLWAVSLGVAYFAVYRLVLRHIRELRGQMRRFAVGDRSQLPRVIREAPAEIVDVSQTFHNMARILIRDEEQLENAVNEKTVLLKEVHHRVKNNLQLIVSIINMQNRLIKDPDAKAVLRSVQDRVASLATIYRNLYQAEHLDAVEAGRLIGDIMNQMSIAVSETSAGLEVSTNLMPLTLFPDQAVPLSLLATEAFTNAMKYAGPKEGEKAGWVRASLWTELPDKAVLEISNSLAPIRGQQLLDDSTGLGSQLIEAFATQLDGDVEIIEDEEVYTLRVRFSIEGALQGEPEIRAVFLTSAPRPGASH